MRFTIDTQELNSGINTVIKAIGNRTTISILEGIYLEATFNGLLLRCTDLSLQIETILPAHVSQEGACVMPGRLFSELARRLPGEETEIYTRYTSAAAGPAPICKAKTPGNSTVCPR